MSPTATRRCASASSPDRRPAGRSPTGPRTLILRNEGIDYYNQWVAHEVPFNDPPVVDAMPPVADLWAEPDAVYAAGGSIAATPFGDNGPAARRRQLHDAPPGHFFAVVLPGGDGVRRRPGADRLLLLPGQRGRRPSWSPAPRRRVPRCPRGVAVMNYYGSPEYADTRQQAQPPARAGGDASSGFLSAATNADPSVYTAARAGLPRDPGRPPIRRFDASDQMPADVGSGRSGARARRS